MIRSIRIDDPPMDPKGRRPEARAGVEQELSRKRLSIDGLAVYLDTTASIETVVPPMDEASGHAASSSSSAGAAPGLPGRGHGDCMAEWEARMLAMIAMPAGPAHVLGPVDLSVEAKFDLTGKVRRSPLSPPLSHACPAPDIIAHLRDGPPTLLWFALLLLLLLLLLLPLLPLGCCRCCYRSSRTRSTPHALSSTSTSRTSSRYA